MEGEVKLERGGVSLGMLREGSFVVSRLRHIASTASAAPKRRPFDGVPPVRSECMPLSEPYTVAHNSRIVITVRRGLTYCLQR